MMENILLNNSIISELLSRCIIYRWYRVGIIVDCYSKISTIERKVEELCDTNQVYKITKSPSQTLICFQNNSTIEIKNANREGNWRGIKYHELFIDNGIQNTELKSVLLATKIPYDLNFRDDLEFMWFSKDD